MNHLGVESGLGPKIKLLYSTQTSTFIKGPTSYLVQKPFLHLGQSNISVNPGIWGFDQLRPFLDICSTRTLNDFCCRVQLESFGQGSKIWSTSHIPIYLIKQFNQGYNLSFHMTSWLQTSRNFSTGQDGCMLI